MIIEVTQRLLQKDNLNIQEMTAVMEEIMSGQSQTPDIVNFLLALSNKGETADEITAAARVMRAHATRIELTEKIILDTCGTGGDKKGTFNISTITAFVASACGITVAKHGNRSVSSCCGSADILEALGVNLNMEPVQLRDCLKKTGIAFLFAPGLHPAMKYAMPARKQIGARTIFNILGPLTNPAGATHQVVGVFDKALLEKIATVFAKLASRHVLVVHGQDGLDEITTTAATDIAELQNGKISVYSIEPQTYGIQRSTLDDLKGGTAEDNARLFLDILGGSRGPKRDIVLLNAAAAIYTAQKAPSISTAMELARAAIDSGSALRKFQEFKAFSKR